MSLPRFLVLDPHYIGPENVANIQVLVLRLFFLSDFLPIAEQRLVCMEGPRVLEPHGPVQSLPASAAACHLNFLEAQNRPWKKVERAQYCFRIFIAARHNTISTRGRHVADAAT